MGLTIKTTRWTIQRGGLSNWTTLTIGLGPQTGKKSPGSLGESSFVTWTSLLFGEDEPKRRLPGRTMGPAIILRCCLNVIPSDDDVMIVGHMPFIGKLASALIAGDESADIIAFQQGGVVCLERDEDNIWRVKWMIIKELTP